MKFNYKTRLITSMIIIGLMAGIGVSAVFKSNFLAFSGPTVIRVDKANGDNSNNGSSWALAKKTIQAAINTADNTNTYQIWVKGYDNVDCVQSVNCYQENLSLSSKSNIEIYGSFNGTESSLDSRTFSVATVVDGRNIDRIVDLWNSSGIVLDHLKLINGFSQYSAVGGGMRIQANGNITLSNIAIDTAKTKISNNAHGGCIAITDGGSSNVIVSLTDIYLTNCVVPETTTYGGGGLYVNSVKFHATRLTISNSHATYGGGAYIYSTDTLDSYITQSSFVNNTADQDGGGLYFNTEQCGSCFYRNFISGNTAGNYGGAMALTDYTQVNFEDSIFSDNHAKTAAIYVTNSVSMLIANNISNNHSTEGVSAIYSANSNGGMQFRSGASIITYNEGPLAPVDHDNTGPGYSFYYSDLFQNYKVDSLGNKTLATFEHTDEVGAGIGTSDFTDPKYYNLKFLNDPMSYMIGAGAHSIDRGGVTPHVFDYFGAKRPVNGTNAYNYYDPGAFEFPFNYVTNPFNQYLTFYNWLGPDSDKKFSDTESVHVTFSKTTGEKMLDRSIHLGTTDFSGQYPKSAYMLPSANIGSFNGTAIPKDTTGRLCFSYPSYLTKCQNVTNIGDGAPNVPFEMNGGDTKVDNKVNLLDLGEVLSYFGYTAFPCNSTECPNTNYDTEVNLADLGIVLNNFDMIGDTP